MTIRIDTRTAFSPYATTAPEGASRPAPADVLAEAREAIAAQNRSAVRHNSIATSEAAAGIAALLRKSIANQAGAAMLAQANFDPRRIIALLD